MVRVTRTSISTAYNMYGVVRSNGILTINLINMKIKVEAICLKTYVDEDDMQGYCDGDIKCPSDVRIYHKGRKYLVLEKYVDKQFYKIIDKQ